MCKKILTICVCFAFFLQLRAVNQISDDLKSLILAERKSLSNDADCEIKSIQQIFTNVYSNLSVAQFDDDKGWAIFCDNPHLSSNILAMSDKGRFPAYDDLPSSVKLLLFY